MKQTRQKKLIIGGGICALLIVAVLLFFGYKNVFLAGETPGSQQEQSDDTEDTASPDGTGSEASSLPPEGESVVEPSSPPEYDEAELAAAKKIYLDSTRDIEERIDALMGQMTLEEKAAQMVQPEQNGISLEEITKYGVGSVLSGGGSAPASGNTARDWQDHINSIKQAALDSRLGIPVLYGVDGVHGHNNVYGATIFPHNIGLGAADDEALAERIGAAAAEEIRATGIQWTFAPTLANPRNELWGRTYEGFGEDTDIAARLGAAFVRGFQGEPGTDACLSDTHVLATAKHYIGEGYTKDGTNQGDVVMDEDAFETLLQDSLLRPYQAAIDAGARTVMVSFNSVNGLKCHENAYLINDVLKGQLGFTGLVVSDYNGVQQVSGQSYLEQVVNSVNAGVDLFMEPYAWKDTIRALTEGVQSGKITEERIDDAVRRILRVKMEAGLFEEVIASETEQQLMEKFGSEEHREIAREAVRKSLILLKNDTIGDKTVLELLPECRNIFVTGSKADDIGALCGGWTISWQGSKGDITEGTTILEGLQEAAGDRNIFYNTDGNVDRDIDAVIVVVGEDPYAESSGDRSSTTLTVTGEDKMLLENLQTSLAAADRQDIPVIAVLIAGRPITIAEYVDSFDAIIMAGLPGTECGGVADVLLGSYDFTGTLTCTWPWYASDIDAKFDAGSEDLILFRKGTGLTKSGRALKEEGTTIIGEKPEKTAEELAALTGGILNLESTGYVLEAENYNADSYLVQTGNENNISYVDNWGGQWANTKWNVWVPEAGSYRLHFYIAAAKDSRSVSIYYASPCITDDGNANRTTVPMTKTESLTTYEDFTLDVQLEAGSYEFKFMTDTADGADFRLDRIEFERQ